MDKTENLLDNAWQDNIIEFLSDEELLQDKETILKKLSAYQVELLGERIRMPVLPHVVYLNFLLQLLP